MQRQRGLYRHAGIRLGEVQKAAKDDEIETRDLPITRRELGQPSLVEFLNIEPGIQQEKSINNVSNILRHFLNFVLKKLAHKKYWRA